jgi:hypothetical protein
MGVQVAREATQRISTVKKLFLGTAAAMLMCSAVHATEPGWFVNFQTFKNFDLECESMAPDRSHVAFTVKPSEMRIELHNDKGEVFDFPIAKAQAAWNFNVVNQFGNPTKVPEVQYIEMNDNGGKKRLIMYQDHGRRIYYMPGQGNDQHWGYSCV